MSDLLGEALEWLDARRTEHLSRPVLYRRGEDSVQLYATLGTTRYELADEGGMIVQAQATDFIVRARDLVLARAATAPRAGDRILVGQEEEVLTFEVLNLPGEGCWRACEPMGQTIRIHAKRVAAD